MKITKRQLRRIIKEAFISEAKEPMTPEYVTSMLNKGKSVRTGESFMDIAVDGALHADWRTVASAVMDGLWIDDPPVGAPEELEDLLATADVQEGESISRIAAEWGTRHFRGR